MGQGLIQHLLFAFLIRPFLWFAVGFRVRNRHWLPAEGPALVVANHNSHLDTLVLLALAPARALPRYRPAAAADHFLKPGLVGWIAKHVLRIIPIDRSGVGAEVALKPVHEALGRGEIVVLFPEGTRGEPESPERFRRGIAHLAERHPEVPIVPVFLYGLGRALPRGTSWLVPFFCDVSVGRPLEFAGLTVSEIPAAVETAVNALGADIKVGWHEGATAEDGETETAPAREGQGPR